MQDVDDLQWTSSILSRNSDLEEARLESRELHKFILAKSYFDCREFERCAAVFLPSAQLLGSSKGSANAKRGGGNQPTKGKSKEHERESFPASKAHTFHSERLPKLSQKSLFLALYAKYMAGEKKREETTEMILGPQDKGSAVNPDLVSISRMLERYFQERGFEKTGGGWLEYLYGIVLAKGKNEEEAKRWLIRSVHVFPFNWGAWLELNDLLNNTEDVSGSTARVRHAIDLGMQ